MSEENSDELESEEESLSANKGAEKKEMRHKNKMKSSFGGFELLKKNWFMVGVVLVIGFANIAPWLGKKHVNLSF